MVNKLSKIKGVSILNKKCQKSIQGGINNTMTRKCTTDSDCSSGICGVIKIINGRPILLSICAF